MGIRDSIKAHSVVPYLIMVTEYLGYIHTTNVKAVHTIIMVV